MPCAWLQGVPPEFIDIPSQVYEATGIPVTFQALDDGDSDAPLFSTAPARLVTDPIQHTLSVVLRKDLVQPHHIAHELLHLRRNAIESVCLLYPNELATQHDIAFIFQIDNALEHLLFVPEEMAACSASTEWWMREYARLIPGAAGHEINLKMHWLFLHVALRQADELIDRCRQLLLELGGQQMLHEAVKLHRDVESAMPSKMAVLNVVHRLLPRQLLERVGVARFVMRHGQINLVQV